MCVCVFCFFFLEFYVFLVEISGIFWNVLAFFGFIWICLNALDLVSECFVFVLECFGVFKPTQNGWDSSRRFQMIWDFPDVWEWFIQNFQEFWHVWGAALWVAPFMSSPQVSNEQVIPCKAASKLSNSISNSYQVIRLYSHPREEDRTATI